MSKKIKVGVVTAHFNTEIPSKLRDGALRAPALDPSIEVWSVDVPGAIEIPLACQALLDKGCAGVVALGAVIRGDTPHFDYVCLSVERAMTTLILDYKRPVGFGVLTVNTYEQAEERVGGKHGNKGEEAAEAVLAMIRLQIKIKSAKSPTALWPVKNSKKNAVQKTLSAGLTTPKSALAKKQKAGR